MKYIIEQNGDKLSIEQQEGEITTGQFMSFVYNFLKLISNENTEYFILLAIKKYVEGVTKK